MNLSPFDTLAADMSRAWLPSLALFNLSMSRAQETSRLWIDTSDVVTRLWPTYMHENTQERLGRAVPLHEEMPDFDLDKKRTTAELPPLNTHSYRISVGCRLWDFKRTDTAEKLPEFLIVAPDSGSTVEVMNPLLHCFLPYGHVRVMQWIDPHYIPAQVSIGIDHKIDAIIHAVQQKPNCHVISDSQSTITATAATSWMYQNPDLLRSAPASLTVISGPLDASRKPEASINWMATHSFGTPCTVSVGASYPGHGREIIPASIIKLLFKSTKDKPKHPYPIQALDGQYISETLTRVFREYHLAKGCFFYQNKTLSPSAMTCPVFAFAGLADEICTAPQSLAIKDFAPNARHTQHILPGVDHYGMISEHILQNHIVPAIAQGLGIRPTWPAPLT